MKRPRSIAVIVSPARVPVHVFQYRERKGTTHAHYISLIRIIRQTMADFDFTAVNTLLSRRHCGLSSNPRSTLLMSPALLFSDCNCTMLAVGRPLDVTMTFFNGARTLSVVSVIGTALDDGAEVSLRHLRGWVDTYLTSLYGLRADGYPEGTLDFRFRRSSNGSVIDWGEEPSITVRELLGSNQRVQIEIFPLGETALHFGNAE